MKARIQGIEAVCLVCLVSDNRHLYITCEVLLLRQFIYLIPIRVVPVMAPMQI